MYTPTKAELDIIQTGLSNPDYLNYFTDYWFDKGDGTGFRFDRGFLPEYRWQHKIVYAKQPLILALCGIGSGKTLGCGMAAFVWAMSTEGFKFMNGANWAYQSKLMFELINAQIADTPAARFVDNVVEHPYPKITLKYKMGDSNYTSTMEFMSMDKNAVKIFSWRGDWINLDEAALIDNIDIALMNLSTRLTGATARGREYLGRLSLMSNPWTNDSSLILYYYYDMAVGNPEECLAITIPTKANPHVSERQIKNAMRFIPANEQGRLLRGEKPEGKGIYFSKSVVEAAMDPYASEYIKHKVNVEKDTNFIYFQDQSIGCVHFETKTESNMLIMVGDPGVEGAPARNAPVIGIFDTSQLPEQPARLVDFWWGNGHGEIMPFVEQFYGWRNKYNPYFCGVDSTGPQAGLVSMLNVSNMFDFDSSNMLRNRSIVGLDFSGGRKTNYLISLKILLELKMLSIPDMCKGIRSQLLIYDPTKDRHGVPKFPQDIVAMLAMAAFVIRAYYNIENYVEIQDSHVPVYLLGQNTRNKRVPNEIRNARSR